MNLVDGGGSAGASKSILFFFLFICNTDDRMVLTVQLIHLEQAKRKRRQDRGEMSRRARTESTTRAERQQHTANRGEEETE